MARIVAHLTNQNAPLTSPSNAPTIRIRRTDTGALVATDEDMTELGDGSYVYNFVTTATLEYSWRVDADPTAVGQVTAQERYVFGQLSGIEIARIEGDIPALLAAIVADELTAATGSTTTEVRTAATQANDFYNGAVLVVVNAAGVAARVVRDYANTNGAFTVEALPFTPAENDPVYVLALDHRGEEVIRKLVANRSVVNASDTQVDFYEDDGTTVHRSFSVSADRRTKTPL